MKTILLTCWILLLCSLSLSAQENRSFEERLSLKVEYFGELVLHPGLTIGTDYTLKQNNWLTIHWDTSLGGYRHRWNNNSAFLKTSVGSRFSMGSVFADLNLGVGYMHSWADGDMYQRAPDGGVEKTSNWGHAHFMPNASLLVGWDATRKSNRKWMVYIGPEVYLQSSFNHIFLPHLAAKIGFTYILNHR